MTFDIDQYHYFWPFSIEIFTNLDRAILWRFVQCTLLWAKDALNGIVTQYTYKQNSLTNFFSKFVIIFKYNELYQAQIRKILPIFTMTTLSLNAGDHLGSCDNINQWRLRDQYYIEYDSFTCCRVFVLLYLDYISPYVCNQM